MKSLLPLFLILLAALTAKSQDESPEVILWEINRLDTIGGFPVTLIGDPVVIETEDGDAIEFDGVDDGLLIESNPMAGATEFSIEVIFKPYPGGPVEQRFVHMEQDNDNRALIELRLTPEDDWFLDTFIKSGSSSKALYAENFPHATNEWWHACLVYKDNVMTHYVNGIEELSDEVFFQEVSSGSTSIGVRQNLVSWYKGAIKTLKVTHEALSPEEFIIPDTAAGPSSIVVQNQGESSIDSGMHPNPVIDAASIDYSVDKPARVIVRVYNTQSIQVSELVNKVQSTGKYHTAFNREALPSGLYFYSIQIDEQVSTKKFLIMD